VKSQTLEGGFILVILLLTALKHEMSGTRLFTYLTCCIQTACRCCMH